MILSDRSIKEELAAGRIELDPFDESLVQPASVDVRLDHYFRVFLNHTMPVIDVKKDLEELTRLVDIEDDRTFVLHPGEFVLGSTLERVALPDDLVGRVEGKSSLGRLGLLIHSTAGFIDPGWNGHITLELSNVANLPITLYPGMKIGQISFLRMTTPADVPYGAGRPEVEVPGPARAHARAATGRTSTRVSAGSVQPGADVDAQLGLDAAGGDAGQVGRPLEVVALVERAGPRDERAPPGRGRRR